MEKAPENSMELVVKMIDISYNGHAEILRKSRTMGEYNITPNLQSKFKHHKQGVRKDLVKSKIWKSSHESCAPYQRYGQGFNLCQTNSSSLRGELSYSLFVNWVYEFRKSEDSLEQAVEKAIQKSKEENILTEFLQKNGTEVLSMLFTEVTREEYGDIREQEGLEKGLERGIEQKALEAARNLKNKGLPDEIIAECVDIPLDVVLGL